MTAIPLNTRTAGTTHVDRALLRTAATLDGFVFTRLQKRSASERRDAMRARHTAADARRDAVARGQAGILPR